MQHCWLEHSTHIVEMVTHVVSNCVFPYSWDHPPMMDNNQDITVFHTFGVHPRLADGSIPWEKVHASVMSSVCYRIGECGLDRTISHMPEQKTNFEKQLKWAMELKKPLVLHLRGKDHKDTLAVYKEALEVAGNVLGKRHAVYLHCFTADYPTFWCGGNASGTCWWGWHGRRHRPRISLDWDVGFPLNAWYLSPTALTSHHLVMPWTLHIYCPVRLLRCPNFATCPSRFCWRLATITWPGSLVGCGCRLNEGK